MVGLQTAALLLMWLPMEVLVRGPGRCCKLLRLVLSLKLLGLLVESCILGKGKMTDAPTNS